MNATLTHRALSAYENRAALQAQARAESNRLAIRDARARWLSLLGDHSTEDWFIQQSRLFVTIDGLTLSQGYGRPPGATSYRHFLILQGDPDAKRLISLEGLGAAITRRNARKQ